MTERLPDPLHLDAMTRQTLWDAVREAIEAYGREVAQLSASGVQDASEVRKVLGRLDFKDPLPPREVIDHVIDAMRRLQPQVSHPRHFGLFDPAPTAVGILGDALAAAFNPCLASWAGSPFGVEAEALLVREFARKFGYPEQDADGILTSGGSEANLSALMLALTDRFPWHRAHGIRRCVQQPVVYWTSESHPSLRKAALVTGLGMSSVREVPTDLAQRMDVAALERMLEADVAAGLSPLAVIATAGTTGAGVVDPINMIADTTERHGVWLHVDAAWGGAVVLLPELRAELEGIQRADSITFDPHKWLSVPMGCGLLMTRHRGLLDTAFGVGASFLLDLDGPAPDPYGRSIRWSRQFAGLKLLLSLAVAGWSGYEHALRRQVRLGKRLRAALTDAGWMLVNDTCLPVVCFTGGSFEGADEQRVLDAVARVVNRSGEARIFLVQTGGRPALRACVTNYATTDADIDLLVDVLSRARVAVEKGEGLDDVHFPPTECGGGVCGVG